MASRGPYKKRDPTERFREKVQGGDGCWAWTGRVKDGRGMFSVGGKAVRPYVYAWELGNGPVPAGKELHHKCESPRCVNPAHIELVGKAEHRHRHRSEVCQRGHPMTEANAIVRRNGKRNCRECKRLRDRWRRNHGSVPFVL